MRSVDVAIVGAGAAGSAAACVLAPVASVALIDRMAVPLWRVGESLPGAARRLLMALGAWERFTKADHNHAPLKVSRWGSAETQELDTMRDPDGSGWRLNRAQFETDLRADATARGATLITASVKRLARIPTGWAILLDTGETLLARRLIDASGRRSSLLRPFGQKRVVLDRLGCVFQRVPQSTTADPTTYIESVEDGWWYTAMLPTGERLIAFHGDAHTPALRRVLRQGPLAAARELPTVSEAIGEVEVERFGQPQLCAANSVARSAAGAGWLACGDSAMSLDPLSSQGLFNALATGLEAGEATLEILGGNAQATTGYATRISQIWYSYVRHHILYYGMERRWADSPFWAYRSALITA